jgi:hypothetical protein
MSLPVGVCLGDGTVILLRAQPSSSRPGLESNSSSAPMIVVYDTALLGEALEIFQPEATANSTQKKSSSTNNFYLLCWVRVPGCCGAAESPPPIRVLLRLLLLLQCMVIMQSSLRPQLP